MTQRAEGETVGVLGGAYDPPHNAHLTVARIAIERFSLRRLLVVVTGLAPHKAVETDAETRFRLASAAFADVPKVEVSRHELDRPGPSWSVDTARWAAEAFGDVVLLVGADEFAAFPAWREPDRLLELVRLGVATRPGTSRAMLDGVLRRLERPERVEFFDVPAMAVSSSDVRARVRRHESIDGLVPAGVARLVAELGLYLDPVSPSRVP